MSSAAFTGRAAFLCRPTPDQNRAAHVFRMKIMEITHTTVTGRFEVATASGSVYLLDFDKMTSVRRPRAAAAFEATEPSSDLRKDDKAVPLVRVVDCIVGQPLTLCLGGLDTYTGYVGTTRFATRVVTITALP
jgi:hypothetical protein